ncbi:TIGR03084 family metal-binding protein [Hyphococcus lacteus]|uniref:TIGR03084 family metal-binding protein n=1 Tax=Hyphococcus lacteus TaxID=3143536 RepID=A0ABV3Z146_9PROT
MHNAAKDFLTECDTLYDLLCNIDEQDLKCVTQFKKWTIEDIVAHLHMWNVTALLTLKDQEQFRSFLADILPVMGQEGHIKAQRFWLEKHSNNAQGRALIDTWRSFYPQLAGAYRQTSPDQRVAWVGPEMTTTAKIIARQMESWAHGQAIFDILGAEREDSDRIRNICHLGVTTYSWTFRNRQITPPQPKPHVRLTAPSGAEWSWNDAQTDNFVRGSAVEFAQVVTQTRNIADTKLETFGDAATQWMAIAQCFAGPPEDPPAIGTRFINKWRVQIKIR